MSLEGLITLFALFVAIYAIIPRYRKIEIFLKFKIIDLIFILFAFGLIHYLQFYQFFAKIGLNLNFDLSKYYFTPQNVTYLIILLVILIMYLRFKFSKIPKNRIKKFHSLAVELLRTKQYSELFTLFEKNLKRLTKIRHVDFLLPKIKEKYIPLWPTPVFLNDDDDENVFRKYYKLFSVKIVNYLNRSIKYIVKYFPDYRDYQDDVYELFKNLFNSEEFLKAVVDIQPYLSLKIFSLNVDESKDFFYKYMTISYKNTSSVLYYELENNLNISVNNLYDLPESNRLLFHMFKDCKIAEKYMSWKPIGDSVINELDKLKRNESPDFYNLPMDDYYDDGKWKSTLYMAILYFDIMVSSALHQGITWHMWLYYFPHFIEGMLNNYNPESRLIDRNAEWPTKYEYLMYSIIATLCHWTGIIKDLPVDQENIILKSNNNSHENGNIPKSGIIALGSCIYSILTKDSITDKFKIYIMDTVFSLYFNLLQVPELLDYSIVLKKSIKQGGSFDRRHYSQYHSDILMTFERHDKFHYDIDHINDFIAFINS